LKCGSSIIGLSIVVVAVYEKSSSLRSSVMALGSSVIEEATCLLLGEAQALANSI